MRTPNWPGPILMLFAAVFHLALSADDNWPQWRGPGGNGISPDKISKLDWSATNGISWKTAIEGRGHSSPIVWGDRVFLTTGIEGDVIPGAKAPVHVLEGQVFKHPESRGSDRKQTFKVLCLDRRTGKILWNETAYSGRVFDDYHAKGAYASPTPATDGQHVFAYFGSEGLYCFDFDGKLLWKTSPGEISTVGMGTGTSPVLHSGLVFLQCDQKEGEGSFIAGYDQKSGKEIWKQDRKVQASWATPILVGQEAAATLVASGAEWIIGYAPPTGRELWRLKGLENNAVPSPVSDSNTVYLSAGYPKKKTVAIRMGGAGDLTASTNVLWTYTKGSAYVPSPILYQGYFYLLTDSGLMSCLDAHSGEVKYEGERLPDRGNVSASPVAIDGKILLTTEAGTTFVIKAGPKHEILGKNSLGEPVFASIAVASDQLFIRGTTNLYCIGSKI